MLHLVSISLLSNDSLELRLQVRYSISDAEDEFYFDDASTFDGSGAETNLTDVELELEFGERLVTQPFDQANDQNVQFVYRRF